jgi:hypothetical protein
MTDEPTPSPHALPPLPAGQSRDPAIQAAVDAENLRLLEIVYYIAGGVTALFSCFFILHFIMFLVIGLNPQFFNNGPNHAATPPPAGLFLGVAAFIGALILAGWTFGGLQIYTGRCLKNRKHRTFVLIIAGLETCFIPWGTAIGIWTILLLQRPGVKASFAAPSTSAG